GIPTASIPDGRLEAHFGFLARLIALDNPTTSLVTRRILGWDRSTPASSPTSTTATISPRACGRTAGVRRARGTEGTAEPATVRSEEPAFEFSERAVAAPGAITTLNGGPPCSPSAEMRPPPGDYRTASR